MRKRTIIVLFILILLMIPFPTKVVDAWSLHVKDQNGLPLANTEVERTCSDYTYGIENICGTYPESRQTTDDNGAVNFDGVALWSNAIARVSFGAISILKLPFHGTIGTSATLFIHSRYEVDPSVVNLDIGPPAEGLIVVSKSAE